MTLNDFWWVPPVLVSIGALALVNWQHPGRGVGVPDAASRFVDLLFTLILVAAMWLGIFVYRSWP